MISKQEKTSLKIKKASLANKKNIFEKQETSLKKKSTQVQMI